MYEFKLAQFRGPLDLLLELIEAQKLDISEVAMAQVTDQYLHHVENLGAIPVEELADFLVVASRLLYIKSKILLPFLMPPEEEGSDLETQLRIYKEYLEASKAVQTIIGKRRFLFVHEKLPQMDIGFSPPERFTAGDMRGLLLSLLSRIEPAVQAPKAVIEKTVSIQEKIAHIRGLFARAQTVKFSSVLIDAETKTEIIVSFLALLELVKQRVVAVEQDSKFREITLKKVEAIAA